MAHSVEIPYLDKKNVLVVDDKDLYCMKIVGLRPKDVEDMNCIARRLKDAGVKPNDIENNFERLYGNKYYLLNDDMKLMYVNLQLGLIFKIIEANYYFKTYIIYDKINVSNLY